MYFTSTEAKNGEQELRVDAQVIYLPILHVTMPTDGTVTVTGYGKTSPADPSSDPSSVVLTHQQALHLRSAISHLKDMGQNGMCMEDSILLKIKVGEERQGGVERHRRRMPGRAHDHVGDLKSDSRQPIVRVLERRRLVLPSVQASGTKSASHQICSSP